MTFSLEVYLVIKQDVAPENQQMRNWAEETCRKFGFYATDVAMVSECDDWFQHAVEGHAHIPSDRLFLIEVSSTKGGSMGDWSLKDEAAKELMKGTHARWTRRLTEHLPRPLATADLDDAIRTVFKDEEDADALRDMYIRCIDGYRQTSLIKCLDALWSNPIFVKNVGMLTLSQGTFGLSTYEVGYEDMLKDLWMQMCFFVWEEIDYLIKESKGTELEATEVRNSRAGCK